LDRLWAFDNIAEAKCVLIKAADNDEGRSAQFSRQRSELEQFFGASLTRKEGKNLHLTREGTELVGIIRESFLKMADFKAQCSRLPKHFSIGAGDSLLHWLVIPRLAELHTSHKDYSFSLHNLQNAEIMAGLVPELLLALKTERYASVLRSFASQELDASRFEQISRWYTRSTRSFGQERLETQNSQ